MTDRRVMNHMDGETKLVHLRLEAWANWSKNNPEMREYPEATLLHRVAEQGVTGAAQGSAPISMPKPIETTERAVLRLGEIDRRVIKTYYLGYGPISILARKARMKEREFETVLRRARFRISGYIAGMEDNHA